MVSAASVVLLVAVTTAVGEAIHATGAEVLAQDRAALFGVNADLSCVPLPGSGNASP